MKKYVRATALIAVLGATIYFILVVSGWKRNAGEATPDGILSTGPSEKMPASTLERADSRGDFQPISHDNNASSSSASNTVTLNFEQQLLANRSMDSKKIETLLFSKKFDRTIDKFRNESASSSDAFELTELYGKLLSEHLEKNNISANLAVLTCGTTLCVGSLKNGTDAEYEKWAGIIFNDTSIPMHGFINTTVQLDEKTWEHRFVFSADPLSSSISAPMR